MNFPLPVSAVTLDLDGTLLDTIPDIAAAANLMLAELGRTPIALETIRIFVGKGIPRLVERTLAADVHGRIADDALKAQALEIFERHYRATNGRHTLVYPGVREGLDLLKAQSFPLACVTNKSTRFTLPLLDMVGFSRYFEHVVGGDTLPVKKPDPAPLLHASEALGVAAADMLMIGDSVNDTRAARAAGCPVFCVTYGYNEGRDVRELDTDAIVGSLVDATSLIVKA
jgi:phosphoglycolate phosphatase